MFDFSAIYGSTPCEITGISDVEITIDGCPTFTVGCSFTPSKPGHTAYGAAAEESGNLSLIPNPNKGIFTLRGALPDIGTAKSVAIHVVDMLGQVVLTDVADISNGNIDKSLTMDEKIANGMYMVRITGAGVNEVIKFTLAT